jgi:FKBP-type peptidyl-prolyl cis-trans isomerase
MLITCGSRFDAGLYSMCPGERRRLKIAPEFGYGAKGVPGAIPPNSTLSKSSIR